MYHALIMLSVCMLGSCFMLNDVYRKKRSSNLLSSMESSCIGALAGIIVLFIINGIKFEFTLFTAIMSLLTALNGICFTYITHSLGPVMRATGATPRKVSAHACFDPIPSDAPSSSFVGDRAAIILTENDDGSVFRVTGCAGFGGHGNSYRICGDKGQIENLRGMGDQVMLRYNEWDLPEGKQQINLYTPSWNDPDEEIIKKSGHGGGDYLTARYFLECVANGVQPEHPFDVYSAVVMSSVAILGHRSVLNGGKPYDIPDFRCEEDCKAYENDRETPFYNLNGGKPTIPCCSHTDFRPTAEQMAWNRKLIEE